MQNFKTFCTKLKGILIYTLNRWVWAWIFFLTSHKLRCMVGVSRGTKSTVNEPTKLWPNSYWNSFPYYFYPYLLSFCHLPVSRTYQACSCLRAFAHAVPLACDMISPYFSWLISWPVVGLYSNAAFSVKLSLISLFKIVLLPLPCRYTHMLQILHILWWHLTSKFAALSPAPRIGLAESRAQ